MANININDGLEKITINGDENRAIYVRTTDYNITSRAYQAQKNINTFLSSIKNKNPDNPKALVDFINTVDKKIREEINYIFDADVSDTVFGRCLPLAVVDKDTGTTYVEAFLDAIMPEIKAMTEQAREASEARIKKHTNKYAKI